jgi:hypothetical protein
VSFSVVLSGDSQISHFLVVGEDGRGDLGLVRKFRSGFGGSLDSKGP